MAKKTVKTANEHYEGRDRSFIKIDELSELIGFSKSWIRSLTSRHLLPHYRLNSRNISSINHTSNPIIKS